MLQKMVGNFTLESFEGGGNLFANTGEAGEETNLLNNRFDPLIRPIALLKVKSPSTIPIEQHRQSKVVSTCAKVTLLAMHPKVFYLLGLLV